MWSELSNDHVNVAVNLLLVNFGLRGLIHLVWYPMTHEFHLVFC